MKRNSILAVLLFLTLGLWAQVDSSELNKYFDDGRKTIKKINLIAKFSAVELINGSLSFGLEKAISNRCTVDVGLGYLLPYYVSEIPMIISASDLPGYELKYVKSGFGWRINPRYYTRAKHKANVEGKRNFYAGTPALQGFFVSLFVRQRYYSLETSSNPNIGNHIKSVLNTDVGFSFGNQILKVNRFVLDYYAGMGFRFISDHYLTGERNRSAFLIIPIGVRLGIRI